MFGFLCSYLLSAHGGLAKDELTVGVATGEMAALLVILRPDAALHHEGGVGRGKVRQQGQVHRGAQVVAVADGHVLDALGEEGVEGSAADQGGIQVAVAGGAPLVVGVGRAGRRLESGSIQFRDLVLHHFEAVNQGRVAL